MTVSVFNALVADMGFNMRFAGSGKHFVGGVLAVAALLGSAGARADLVTNGGFETGGFDGWTIAPSGFDGVDTGSPQAGTYAAYFGNPSGTTTLSQTLSTYANGIYDVSFWLKNEADIFGDTSPNSFEFDWDGTQVMAIANAVASGYTQYQFTLTTTGTSTDLSFSFGHGPAFWDFDSVTVENHVPEPGSFALAGLAGVLALTARRRRSAKA